MIQEGILQNDNVQPSSTYPAVYEWLVASTSLVYVITVFGLNGVPDVSMLGFFSAVFLFLLLFLYIGKLQLPSWTLIILSFYFYMILPAFGLETPPIEKISMLTTAFIGALSIGLALQNKILSYNILAFGAIIAAVINIVAVHAGVDMSPLAEKAQRYSGLMGNANALSMSMAFAALLIWLFPERFNLPVRMLGISIAFYGMYVSASRKGALMVAALLLLVFLKHVITLSKAKIILYITMITTSMLAFYEVLKEIFVQYSTKILVVDRLMDTFTGQEVSFNTRVSLIDTGWELWEKAPLFGYGFDQFSSLAGTSSYAHNNYIELAVSGGIIALMLFYSLHFTILHNAIKQADELRLRLLILVAAILVIDTATVSFYDKSVMCMLGIFLAVSSEQQEIDV